MWKRLVWATVFSVYSFNLSVSWGTTSASATGKIQLVEATLAVVNKEPILFSDLRLYQLLFQISDAKKALEKLIDIYLVSQYAKERGVKIPPQKIQEIIRDFARSMGLSEEQFYQSLEEENLGGSVFANFIEKYNLYLATINYFVVQPLLKNKEELNYLIAKYSHSKPIYDFIVLRIPKKIAEKNLDLLASGNIEEIEKKLNVKAIEMQASLSEIKPSFAKVIKKFHHPNQYDFIEDKDYIYLLKLKAIHYKPIANKEEILKKIKEEKIKEFVKNLKKNAIIKILVK